MKQFVKILLLLAAGIGVAAVVMYFYRTIVMPPVELEYGNQFEASLRKDIAGIKQIAKTDASVDSFYFSIMDQIRLFSDEELIGPQERDVALEEFVKAYVPEFEKLCLVKFSLPVWYEDELTRIKERIAELKQLRLSDSRSVFGADAAVSGKLYKLDDIVNKYFEAKQIAENTGFVSIENSRDKIAKAARYAQMDYLKNCVALVTELMNVPGRLEEAHFRYLAGRVEQLRYYRSYEEADFTNLANRIDAELKDYKDKAAGVYGTVRDTDALWNRAVDYCTEAYGYYNEQEEYNNNIIW